MGVGGIWVSAGFVRILVAVTTTNSATDNDDTDYGWSTGLGSYAVVLTEAKFMQSLHGGHGIGTMRAFFCCHDLMTAAAVSATDFNQSTFNLFLNSGMDRPEVDMDLIHP